MIDLLKQVAETVEECRLGDTGGFWRSCTGCHETNEGYETGWYPYSSEFKCYLGGGCSECGGIGAIWDTTDYEDFANYLASKSISEFEEGKLSGLEEARQVALEEYHNALNHLKKGNFDEAPLLESFANGVQHAYGNIAFYIAKLKDK